MSGIVVLVRHGQSEWNLKNLFTGWRDPDLTKKGIEEAKQAGKNLKSEDITFNIVFTSRLQRAQKTAQLILEEMGQKHLFVIKDVALNERDYGALSGLNKDDARQKWGEEQVHIWRRSYDIAPPEGESLRDTAARVWPYYMHHIQPHILRGENVLIVAHGNSLRALIMALEGLDKNEIMQEEIATAVPIIYHLRADSTIMEKKILCDPKV